MSYPPPLDILGIIADRFPAYRVWAERFYEEYGGQNLCLRALYDSLQAPQLTLDQALEIERTHCGPLNYVDWKQELPK